MVPAHARAMPGHHASHHRTSRLDRPCIDFRPCSHSIVGYRSSCSFLSAMRWLWVVGLSQARSSPSQAIACFCLFRIRLPSDRSVNTGSDAITTQISSCLLPSSAVPVNCVDQRRSTVSTVSVAELYSHIIISNIPKKVFLGLKMRH